MCTKSLTTPVCIQDAVHIGVKLKCRLLKPSIVLPLGNYVASSSHLHILVRQYGKDQHGLRNRDLNHSDKQNFAAVQHIIKASTLLDGMADAIGTKHYIRIMSLVTSSFLDKSLSSAKRLKNIWYAVFLEAMATFTANIYFGTQFHNS